MQFMQQNAVYIFLALFIGWMLWQRIIAPKLSGVKTISAGEYLQMRKQPHTLLDVRQPGEWASGHPKTAMHIPLGEVAKRMNEIEKDKPVVVICASGNRSAMAATALAKSGFATVYNFSGGMSAWQGAGLPLKSGA
ncbi:MAG: rhodanese-like domain-containing protein [Mariprofundus sp.]|nr:rhodanese-like domain-containing protein [Mariprofundus sp.]